MAKIQASQQQQMVSLIRQKFKEPMTTSMHSNFDPNHTNLLGSLQLFTSVDEPQKSKRAQN